MKHDNKDIDETIDRIKRHLGCATDLGLAVKLATHPASIYKWRKAGAIPVRWLLSLEHEHGVPRAMLGTPQKES